MQWGIHIKPYSTKDNQKQPKRMLTANVIQNILYEKTESKFKLKK